MTFEELSKIDIFTRCDIIAAMTQEEKDSVLATAPNQVLAKMTDEELDHQLQYQLNKIENILDEMIKLTNDLPELKK